MSKIVMVGRYLRQKHYRPIANLSSISHRGVSPTFHPEVELIEMSVYTVISMVSSQEVRLEFY